MKPTAAALLAGLLSIAFILPSTSVLAQDGSSSGTKINDEGFAEPSEAQLEMNEKGVKAIVNGEFDKASRLFQASIDLGKLNITYLNLGRALQKARRCREAKQAYLSVKDSSTPKVKNPPPFEISSRAEQYLAELERNCPGEVEVTCAPRDLADDVQVFINTRGPKACNAEPFEVPPGEVVVKGVLGEQIIEEVATVDPVELASVTLTFERPPEPKDDPVAETSDDRDDAEEAEEQENAEQTAQNEMVEDQNTTDEDATAATADTPSDQTSRPPPTGNDVSLEESTEPDDESSSGGGGWWMAAGTGLIAGGLYFDVIAPTSRNGTLDEVDFIPPSTYLLGGIAIIYGLTNL